MSTRTFNSSYLASVRLHRPATCCSLKPQMPAACPSRFMRFCSFASFPVMPLSALTSLSRLGSIHSSSECTCIFGAFPLQRLSSSQSPVELRTSCQCPLWLKTTALILRWITTAILTSLQTRKHNLTLLLVWHRGKKMKSCALFVLLAAVLRTSSQYWRTKINWLNQQSSKAKSVASWWFYS